MRLLFALAMLSASLAVADERPGEIPLKSIWANDMPGTRNIRELEPEFFEEVIDGDRRLYKNRNDRFRDSIYWHFGGALDHLQPGGEARKGFAVTGTGLDAFREADQVLNKGARPRKSFAEGKDVSIVYFSHQAGTNIYLDDVTREGNVIKVPFFPVPRGERDLPANYAIIPLGKLPAGKYRVQIVQVPMTQKYIDAGYTQPPRPAIFDRVVSKSFAFEVVKPADAAKEP